MSCTNKIYQRPTEEVFHFPKSVYICIHLEEEKKGAETLDTYKTLIQLIIKPQGQVTTTKKMISKSHWQNPV